MDIIVISHKRCVTPVFCRFLTSLEKKLSCRVTQAVLPGVLQGKRWAIVIPSDPFYAVYVATKAYVGQFLRCLYVEYKNGGIDV
nr:hypothetical protein [Tanacetum cinerariifolium]